MRVARTAFAGALILAAAVCGPVLAQAPQAPSADMAMPDDLGAPLDGAPAPITPAAGRALTVSMPIEQIASTTGGRAVLDRDVPGLCERPEYMMFKGMSLTKLASLSRGRITPTDLERVQVDLSRVSVGEPPQPAHTYSIFTRGSRAVGHVSKAIYRRVVLIVASL